MKYIKNQKLYMVWMRCALLALIASVILFLVMLQIERHTLAGGEKKMAWMTIREVPKGVVLSGENWQEYLEQRQVDADLISETGIMDVGYWEDVSAVFSIEKGTLVTRGMFESRQQVLGAMKEPVVAGFRAEDLYQVAGGALRPGDHIHIFILDEEGKVRKWWENLYVHQVFDNNGNLVVAGDPETAASRVNIYIEKERVEEFYANLAAGSLRVVKVCR
ncbi:MAG: hypothetical protein IJ327_00665 [Lachnospiraceae bacterium]|nr:hypothetical protein [Lachnospiraceae bacterium]